MSCTALTADKLSKIAGLTTSPNDSEALAAVKKLNDLMANAGLTWGALFDSALLAQATHERPRTTVSADDYQPARWRRHLHEAKFWKGHLSRRDCEFLDGVDGRVSLSPKQHEWMRSIAARIASLAAERGA